MNPSKPIALIATQNEFDWAFSASSRDAVKKGIDHYYKTTSIIGRSLEQWVNAAKLLIKQKVDLLVLGAHGNQYSICPNTDAKGGYDVRSQTSQEQLAALVSIVGKRGIILTQSCSNGSKEDLSSINILERIAELSMPGQIVIGSKTSNIGFYFLDKDHIVITNESNTRIYMKNQLGKVVEIDSHDLKMMTELLYGIENHIYKSYEYLSLLDEPDKMKQYLKMHPEIQKKIHEELASVTYKKSFTKGTKWWEILTELEKHRADFCHNSSEEIVYRPHNRTNNITETNNNIMWNDPLKKADEYTKIYLFILKLWAIDRYKSALLGLDNGEIKFFNNPGAEALHALTGEVPHMNEVKLYHLLGITERVKAEFNSKNTINADWFKTSFTGTCFNEKCEAFYKSIIHKGRNSLSPSKKDSIRILKKASDRYEEFLRKFQYEEGSELEKMLISLEMFQLYLNEIHKNKIVIPKEEIETLGYYEPLEIILTDQQKATMNSKAFFKNFVFAVMLLSVADLNKAFEICYDLSNLSIDTQKAPKIDIYNALKENHIKEIYNYIKQCTDDTDLKKALENLNAPCVEEELFYFTKLLIKFDLYDKAIDLIENNPNNEDKFVLIDSVSNYFLHFMKDMVKEKRIMINTRLLNTLDQNGPRIARLLMKVGSTEKVIEVTKLIFNDIKKKNLTIEFGKKYLVRLEKFNHGKRILITRDILNKMNKESTLIASFLIENDELDLALKVMNEGLDEDKQKELLDHLLGSYINNFDMFKSNANFKTLNKNIIQSLISANHYEKLNHFLFCHKEDYKKELLFYTLETINQKLKNHLLNFEHSFHLVKTFLDSNFSRGVGKCLNQTNSEARVRVINKIASHILTLDPKTDEFNSKLMTMIQVLLPKDIDQQWFNLTKLTTCCEEKLQKWAKWLTTDPIKSILYSCNSAEILQIHKSQIGMRYSNTTLQNSETVMNFFIELVDLNLFNPFMQLFSEYHLNMTSQSKSKLIDNLENNPEFKKNNEVTIQMIQLLQNCKLYNEADRLIDTNKRSHIGLLLDLSRAVANDPSAKIDAYLPLKLINQGFFSNVSEIIGKIKDQRQKDRIAKKLRELPLKVEITNIKQLLKLYQSLSDDDLLPVTAVNIEQLFARLQLDYDGEYAGSLLDYALKNFPDANYNFLKNYLKEIPGTIIQAFACNELFEKATLFYRMIRNERTRDKVKRALLNSDDEKVIKFAESLNL